MGVAFIVSMVDRGPFTSGLPYQNVSRSRILGAWKNRDYGSVLQMTADSLASRPVDPFYLVFSGLSAFYRALSLPEGEERSLLLDTCVVTIRKAIATGRGNPVKAQAEYVLGKAYYHKGPSYQDLAARYMQRSLTDGYLAGDSHEYLGVIHAGLGQYAEATAHFEKALATDRSDLLLLAAARAWQDSGNIEKAETLYKEILSAGVDAMIREKAALLLGNIYLERKDYKAAEAGMQAVLAKNPESADAWYVLGLVQQERGDQVRARAAWRKAVSIDPMHAGSRQKLREKF